MKRDDMMFLTAVAMVATWYAMQQPNCDRGCKTNLEHLFQHELKFFLTGGTEI